MLRMDSLFLTYFFALTNKCIGVYIRIHIPMETNNKYICNEKVPFLRCNPAIINILNPDILTRKPASLE